MDCVNHTALMRRPIARTAARHSAQGACATRQVDRFCANRARRHGTAINNHLPPRIPESEPFGGGDSGPDSGRRRDVQRPVHQGPGSCGDLRDYREYVPVLRDIRLFIAAWILYQSFEAYHTAKARRDGMPLPDPLGLNEVGNWFNPGARGQYPGHPGGWPMGQGPSAPGPAGPAQTAGEAGGQGAAEPGGGYQTPFQGQYQQSPYQQSPYQQPPYQTPYQGPNQGPYAPPVPPIPPVAPVGWRRKEPIGAIVLIGLGTAFPVGTVGYFLRPAG